MHTATIKPSLLVRADGKKWDFISTLGSSGRLYFEIRKDGNPVNPERYLN